MSRSSTRIGYAFFTVAMTALLLGSTAFSQSEGKSLHEDRSSAASSVEIKWIACAGQRDEFFRVRVSPDGTANFIGGPQSRVIGERTTQVDPMRARKLISESRRFVAKAQRDAALKATGKRELCIDVSVDDERGQIARVERADYAEAQLLVAISHETVVLEKWVCPARQAMTTLLRGTVYCGSETIPVVVSIPTSGTCASADVAEIYEDGAIYLYTEYKPVGSEGRPSSAQVVDGDVAVLPRELFAKIVSRVRNSRLVQEEFFSGGISAESRAGARAIDWYGRERGDIDEIIELIRSSGFSWRHVGADPISCTKDGPQAEMFVRSDFGPESHGGK